MTKRVAIWSITAAFLALAAAVPAAASGNEPQGCGLQTLKGTYAFRNEGWLPGQPGQPRVAAAFVGVMTFDGFGGASLSETGSIDGFVFRNGLSGGYTVNADCTGTLVGADGVVTWDLVIADNGKSAFIIWVAPGPPGVTFTGELRRQ
jgi:hypothetical protein